MKRIISFALRTVPRPLLHKITPISMKLLSFFMRGNLYEDPINGISYRKLLPFGRINPRPNALAPDSLSLERHRLMWLYLKEKTDFFTAPLKVLHMAPEDCFRFRFKAMQNLDYTTADLESPWADVHCDICELPFKDNTFDVIFCNHVLEHIKDDKKAISELYRVLKPGGWSILNSCQDLNRTTTYEDASITDPQEREKHFWQNDHMRLYGRDYHKVLAEGGFNVEVSNFASEISAHHAQRYCIYQNEMLYIGRK